MSFSFRNSVPDFCRSTGIDEYGNKGSPVPRFTENKDCQKAFKAYMCYINFPRWG